MTVTITPWAPEAAGFIVLLATTCWVQLNVVAFRIARERARPESQWLRVRGAAGLVLAAAVMARAFVNDAAWSRAVFWAAAAVFVIAAVRIIRIGSCLPDDQEPL